MKAVAILMVLLVATEASIPEMDIRDPYVFITKALVKDAIDKLILEALAFDKISVTQKLDGQGRPIPGSQKGADDGKKYIHISIPKLLRSGRYKLQTEGLAMINDRLAIAIRFWPAPETDQPGPEYASGMGKIDRMVEEGVTEVINNFGGTVYLDQETLGIVRIEAHLRKEITKKIVRIYQLDTTYEQQLAFGIWVPRQNVAVIKISKSRGWFGSDYKKDTTIFTNYHPKAP